MKGWWKILAFLRTRLRPEVKFVNVFVVSIVKQALVNLTTQTFGALIAGSMW